MVGKARGTHLELVCKEPPGLHRELPLFTGAHQHVVCEGLVCGRRHDYGGGRGGDEMSAMCS